MRFFVFSHATLKPVRREPGRRHVPIIVLFHKQVSLRKNMRRTSIAYPELSAFSHTPAGFRPGAIQPVENIRPLNIQ
jgi:hypothetical protein